MSSIFNLKFYYKKWVNVFFPDANTSFLHRHCAPENKCEQQQAAATQNQSLKFCETCTTDLCNRGLSIDQRQILTIFPLLYFVSKILFQFNSVDFITFDIKIV